MYSIIFTLVRYIRVRLGFPVLLTPVFILHDLNFGITGLILCQTCSLLSNPLCVCAQSLSRVQLFCDPMDCTLPGSSVHGIIQARILEWVEITSSRESSQPRDRACISCVSCVGRQILGKLPTHCTLYLISLIFLITWKHLVNLLVISSRSNPRFTQRSFTSSCVLHTLLRNAQALKRSLHISLQYVMFMFASFLYCFPTKLPFEKVCCLPRLRSIQSAH